MIGHNGTTTDNNWFLQQNASDLVYIKGTMEYQVAALQFEFLGSNQLNWTNNRSRSYCLLKNWTNYDLYEAVIQ